MTPYDVLKVALPKVVQLFNELEIPYWIDCGTLLGCIRDNDIIKWDLDADISFLWTPETFDLIHKNIPRLLDNTLMKVIEVRFYGGFKIHCQTTVTWIDIYPWKLNNDNNMIEFTCPGFGVPNRPKSDVESFEKRHFLGVPTNVPSNYHARLTRLYGEYMTPIHPSKRGKLYW